MLRARSSTLGLLMSSFALACGGNGAGTPAPENEATTGGASAVGGSSSLPTGGSGTNAAGTGGSVSTTGGTDAAGGSVSSSGGSEAGGLSGASSGGGDNQPVEVHDCSDLPEPGTWERIDPPGDVGDAQRVVTHPYESGTVFVNMHKGGNGAHYPTDGLYKSTDCGATWSGIISNGENAELVNSGSWWTFIIDPTDADVMYTIDGYGAGGVWKSENAGVDWNQTITGEVADAIPGLFLNGLAMNPNDHLHLIATIHQDCTAGGNCVPETTDGGETWHLLQGKPGDGWGEGQGPMILDSDTFLVGTSFGGLWLSTNHGVDWENVADGAFGAIYQAPGGTYYVPGLWGVLTSPDGLEWDTVEGSGRTAAIAGGTTQFFAADQWSGAYYSAPVDTTTMTAFTNNGMPSESQGAPYLSYDDGHKILYSGNFGGGLWRIVTE